MGQNASFFPYSNSNGIAGSIQPSSPLSMGLRRDRSARADRVALHGATLVCLEEPILGLRAGGKAGAIAALERPQRLREAVCDG